ncbi:MAG: hypothetical protein JWO12_1038 [Frankiales bacterium]|nr:hypothetical protein [Frankiales bacterium]
MAAELVLTVHVQAPVETTWRAVTDWPSQGEWMLGTVVTGTGNSVGGTLQAYTGRRPLGFLDTMVITVWEPPHRCEVLHTGRIVKGTGVFEVRTAPGGSELVWSEVLDLPLGIVGRLGWPLVRPAFKAGVQRSLKRFAAYVERTS